MKVNIPQKFRIGNLLYNKRFTIVLSIVIAFSLWLGIELIENPTRKQTFADIPVVVTIDNTAASDSALGITSDVASQKVTVTVEGPNHIVSSLRAEDISLYASTIDIDTKGTFPLEVKSTNDSKRSGYEITKIEPATISVSFDYIDSKEYTLVPKLIGVSIEDTDSGLIIENPVIANSQQSTITVKGPRSIIEQIASVGTIAEVNRPLSATETFDSDIVLYNDKGEAIYRFTADGKVYNPENREVTNSNLTLSFTSVKVTQPISKKKTVNCVAAFSNLPSGITADDIKYKLSQKTITIIGTPEIIDKVENISLSTIDFRTVSTTDYKFDVSPILPDGVRILEGEEVFQVTIDVSKYEETTIEIKDIRCINLNNDVKAKTSKSIRVKICAPAEIIADIKAGDLYIIIDLADKTVGEHTCEAVVKSEKYDDFWQLGTYSVSVTIY
ncbi:MAG: hypothetical protein IKU82_05010 [Clostridia bacterium]|nr:hypothetical protein [Clostridia bacterium]